MTATRVDVTTARAPVVVGRTRVWVGLWGGGVAWLLHFLSSWALAEFGCLGPLARPGPLGVTWVAWLVVAVTAVFLPLALAATWISWRTERDARAGGAPRSGAPEPGASGARGPHAASPRGPHASTERSSSGTHRADAEALAFAARVGWIAGALFSLVVLAEAAPILFFLRGCGDVGAP